MKFQGGISSILNSSASRVPVRGAYSGTFWQLLAIWPESQIGGLLPPDPLSALLKEMVGRSGFEPLKAMPADLQSAPFGHFGTYPLFFPSRDDGP